MVMDLPSLGGMTEQSWVVPNRNAVFLSVAVNIAIQNGDDAVTIGCNADDAQMFPGCRPLFIKAMNDAVRSAGYPVDILAPYIHTTKAEIMEKAKRFGIERHEIWTCYQPTENGACGTCPACKKLEAVCGQ